MLNKQLNHQNYKPIQGFLQLLSTLYPDQNALSDPHLRLIHDFIDQLDFNLFPSFRHWLAYRFPLSSMLKACLLGFTLYGCPSVRKLADLAAHGIRFLSLFQKAAPSHQTFYNFQVQCLKPAQEEIFRQLNLYIEKKDPALDKQTLYLDGTKLEANANKMTFVWSASTAKYKASAWKQLIELTRQINGWLISHNEPYRISILAKPDPDWLFEAEAFLVSLLHRQQIQMVCGKGRRKYKLQKFHEKFADLGVKLFKYSIYEELADGRNSFSKTDPDAIFMHMKYDYYNHTNVFKPGYNVQLGTSGGYIRVVHISQKCNDLHDFIPTVEKYADLYGEYPQQVPADAGYGSYDNYSYCKEKGIELMMKYAGQNKESGKITDKNRFRAWAFSKTDEGSPVCPAGHTMDLVQTTVSHKGLYPRQISYYGTEHCQECPMRSACTRSKRGRRIQVCHELEEYKKEVRENMATAEGRSTMISRSIQAEGTFGDMKNNFHYDRLKRKGLKNVEFEVLMVACGHNMRKLARRMSMKTEELERYGKSCLS